MKIKILILTLFFSYSAFADTVLGFYAGTNYWNYGMSGKIQSTFSQNQQVDIDFDNNSNNVFYAALEHPVPFLPNFKLQQNTIQSDGLINVSGFTNFPGQSFNVSSDIDFSHTDLMLYYEVLDNWVNLDLGLSFKYFDGYSEFNYETMIDDRSDFDDLIPMLYAKGKIDLPFTGFSASATLEALSFDSNKVTDLNLAVSYESKSGIGAEVGYRSMTVDLVNIGDLTSDIDIDGFYLGVNFHF